MLFLNLVCLTVHLPGLLIVAFEIRLKAEEGEGQLFQKNFSKAGAYGMGCQRG
jgi:hypothetical protein